MKDKNENFDDDFVVNLKNDFKELKGVLDEDKEKRFFIEKIREFFSFSLKKERGVNFIKNW